MRAALLRTPLFSGLGVELADSLAEIGDHFTLPAGGHLMRAGDPSDGMSVLLSGRLCVLSLGAEVVIAEVPVGALVGELGLVTGAPRSASVVAFEPCALWRVSRERYAALLKAADPRAVVLLTGIGAVLCERYREQHLDGLAMVPGLSIRERGRELLGELGWCCE